MRPVRHVPFMLALLVALLAGCSSTIPVKVDAIAAGKPVGDKHYRWFSGMENVSSDDLYFQEFSRYFRSVLRERGYLERKEGDAAIAIYFSYGVTPGKTVYYTTSTPIYDWFGGDTIVYVETKEEGGQISRTTSTVTTPVYRRMVGVDVDTRSYTLYTVFAVLEAKRYEPGKSPGEMKTLWKVTASTTSRSSDLRALMPALALAAAPYLGTDTGEAKLVKIKKDDPRLLALKRQGKAASSAQPEPDR